MTHGTSTCRSLPGSAKHTRDVSRKMMPHAWPKAAAPSSHYVSVARPAAEGVAAEPVLGAGSLESSPLKIASKVGIAWKVSRAQKNLWSPSLDCIVAGTERPGLGLVFLIRQVLTALRSGEGAAAEVGCRPVVCKVPNLMS